ncbi:MAG: CDC27 family protein [Deltaproteobacteria bacterium]|nr:CDC27 family protein [Deltaproteobacteria bacterium]
MKSGREAQDDAPDPAPNGRAMAAGAPRPRRWGCAAVVAGLVLAGCAREPAGIPVALPEGTPADAVTQRRAWRALRNQLLGTRDLEQTWAVAGGITDRTHLREALFVANRIIDIDRQCVAKKTDECLSNLDRAAARAGHGETYGFLWNRQLCDDLSTKAEVLLALGAHKAALAAAQASLQLGEHPYNAKIKGDVLFAMGRFAEALEAYERLKPGQRNPLATLMAGLCLHKLGRNDEARANLSQALAKVPSLRTDVPGAAEAAAALGL